MTPSAPSAARTEARPADRAGAPPPDGRAGARVRAVLAVPLVAVLAAGAAGCMRFSEPGRLPAPSGSAGAASAAARYRPGNAAPVGDAAPLRAQRGVRPDTSPDASSGTWPSVRPSRPAGSAPLPTVTPRTPVPPGPPPTPTAPAGDPTVPAVPPPAASDTAAPPTTPPAADPTQSAEAPQLRHGTRRW